MKNNKQPDALLQNHSLSKQNMIKNTKKSYRNKKLTFMEFQKTNNKLIENNVVKSSQLIIEQI